MSAPMRRRWSARLPLTVGYVALIALVGGLGYWSVRAQIAGAVVASGMIQVESNRQVIQHPEGGVVGDILAKDGDRVAAGEVVLRLDDTLQRSELAVIEGQLIEIIAHKARLAAERDGAEGLSLSEQPHQLTQDNAQFDAVLAGQKRLFQTRRKALAQETAQIDEQILQASNQITGAQAQLTALQEQEVLVAGELADLQTLLEKGATQAFRVSAQQKDHARLKGEIGNAVSNIALLKGEIAALEIQKLRRQTQLREEAITGLRELDQQELELSERRLSLLETLSRLDIRSPVWVSSMTVRSLRYRQSSLRLNRSCLSSRRTNRWSLPRGWNPFTSTKFMSAKRSRSGFQLLIKGLRPRSSAKSPGFRRMFLPMN